MENFKNRLTEFARMQYDMGQNGFEEHCGINKGTINSIKVQGPTASIVTKISLACPELNLNWLFRGEAGGPMLNEGKEQNGTPAHFASPTNDIHNNNVVIIGNWGELGDIVEKAISKAMSKK